MNLSDAFAAQATSCAAMGSPFMAQLLGLLAKDWPHRSALGRKFSGFSGDIGPAGHSLPLRIAGGLHALVLSDAAPGLAAVYPPNATMNPDLRAAVLCALHTHEDFLLNWTESPPQTNEVRRSAALIAGARVAVDYFNLPIVLSELGASGGLNLMWDHYALEINNASFGPAAPALTLRPEWTGPLPPPHAPKIAARRGVDLMPQDPKSPSDLLRLTAYLWADQPERLSLTRAAAEIMDAPIDKGDAIDWLASRLNNERSGHLHLIQHTVAWQYFPAGVKEKGRALIEAAGAKATQSTPLGWLSMESDGDTTGKVGAALTLRLWPGDLTLYLGRADFHGRWIQWQGAG